MFLLFYVIIIIRPFLLFSVVFFYVRPIFALFHYISFCVMLCCTVILSAKLFCVVSSHVECFLILLQILKFSRSLSIILQCIGICS